MRTRLPLGVAIAIVAVVGILVIVGGVFYLRGWRTLRQAPPPPEQLRGMMQQQLQGAMQQQLPATTQQQAPSGVGAPEGLPAEEMRKALETGAPSQPGQTPAPTVPQAQPGAGAVAPSGGAPATQAPAPQPTAPQPESP